MLEWRDKPGNGEIRLSGRNIDHHSANDKSSRDIAKLISCMIPFRHIIERRRWNFGFSVISGDIPPFRPRSIEDFSEKFWVAILRSSVRDSLDRESFHICFC
jgi:hypothetical protein